MAEIVTLTDSNFEEKVLKSDKPVLVGFGAMWCGPWKPLESVLKAMAAEHDRIVVAKLDIDQNPATHSKFGVRGIPTLILFSHGRMEETMMGAMSKDVLEKKFSSWLS